jgi:hypothetical protein
VAKLKDLPSSFPVASSWSDYKMSSTNGSAKDIKISAAEIRTRVSEESKIFNSSSIFNGGTKIQSSK